MTWIKNRLREQTTHSAVVLAIIMLFAAHTAGIDLIGLTRGAGELLAALAIASSAAKVLLPETPPVPKLLTDGAVNRLERKAVEEGDAVPPGMPVANVPPVAPPAPEPPQ